MTERNYITSAENRLYHISRLISLFSRKGGHKYCTLNDLVVASELRIDSLDKKVISLLNHPITEVCRPGSRFVKGCVACQLYEDGGGVMEWAYKHGALVLVTKQQIKDYPCIIVNDPAVIYAKMCSFYSASVNVPVTAVVGSIGKTTTKRMLNTVYSTEYNCFADPENENQLDCVGYIFQHIPRKVEKIVQEISEDTPGCLAQISQIVHPEIAIVTAIDKSHIEAFGDEQGIRNEIFSVQQGMSHGAIIMDGYTAVGFTPKDGIRLITVSIDSDDADYYASDITISDDGLHFTITDKINNLKTPFVLHSVYAVHNIYSALYSYAASVYSGISISNIQKGISKFQTVGIRQNIYKVKDNVTVYADCYNAVAKSMESAINASLKIPVKGKRIAVLGDVEECGEYSFDIHRSILKVIDESDFDELFTYGTAFSTAIAGYQFQKGLQVSVCKDRHDLNKFLKRAIKTNDLVLFKASRKSALEQTISYLWPTSYLIQRIKYMLPIINWRIQILLN